MNKKTFDFIIAKSELVGETKFSTIEGSKNYSSENIVEFLRKQRWWKYVSYYILVKLK